VFASAFVVTSTPARTIVNGAKRNVVIGGGIKTRPVIVDQG
jgi:hypothetical protein